jgi:hypothetical protein
MDMSGRAKRTLGAVLSVVLSLAVAVTLVVASWPEDSPARRPEPAPRAKPLAAPLSVAMVRLPPPPLPSPPFPLAPVAVVVKAITPLKPPAKAEVKPPVQTILTPLRPEPRPAQRAKPKPQPKSPAVKIDKAVAAEGRTLLRLLEHGEGPAIEIAWPSRAAARARLFGYLRGCLGMRVALMDSGNDGGSGKGFYLASGPAGSASELNLDRFSGFMRTPSGRMPDAETRLVASIRDRHLIGNAMPVRLFPRSVDAALLGGLNMAVGQSYGAAKIIHARYRRDASGLYVTDISVDGSKVPGKILLSNRRCSNSGV